MDAPPTPPSHAELCRTLVAAATSAALATLARDPAGFPFASLVSVAVDDQGRPILLLSNLAEHTRNLAERDQASLLFVEAAPPGTDPLAVGRVTVLGRCARIEGADVAPARERFLAAHPEAASYQAFGDFGYFRLMPETLRYVGGFGRMSWVGGEEYAAAG